MASKAFRDKLETLIEEHLIPFSGSKQDDVVHQLLVDESLDGIIEDFTPRLRSIFVAYAGDVPVKRVAFVKVMAAPKQAMTLSLDGLAELLRHAGLQMLHRARLGRIYMELLKMRKVDDLEVDEVFQVKEEPEPLSFLEDNEGASFQYDMSFQEFLDGLIIITLFKEPNPFVSFSIRFEKFLRSLLEKLFDFANDSTEPRFRALHQALEDAFQKDVSAQGLARKLQAAED